MVFHHSNCIGVVFFLSFYVQMFISHSALPFLLQLPQTTPAMLEASIVKFEYKKSPPSPNYFEVVRARGAVAAFRHIGRAIQIKECNDHHHASRQHHPIINSVAVPYLWAGVSCYNAFLEYDMPE